MTLTKTEKKELKELIKSKVDENKSFRFRGFSNFETIAGLIEILDDTTDVIEEMIAKDIEPKEIALLLYETIDEYINFGFIEKVPFIKCFIKKKFVNVILGIVAYVTKKGNKNER